MKKRVPRFYQVEAHDAFFRAIAEPGIKPLIGMPCGTGKSLVIAMIARTAALLRAGIRVCIAVNSKKLVKQNAKTLIDYFPEGDIGIYCDGLDRYDLDKAITVCTIQSIGKKAFLLGKQNGLLIDEVQCVSPKEETLYKKFIDDLLLLNSKMFVGGLSATLYRSKGGFLIEHGLFNKVCYDITGWQAFEKLIQMGFLVPLSSNPTTFHYNVDGIKTTGDDYNQKQAEEEVNQHYKNVRAMREAIARGKDRKHWIVFCQGIKHVDAIVELMQSWGYSCRGAHSKMSDKEADAAIEAFEKGTCQILVSDNMLTVGFDAPWIDHIVILRLSKAVVRHVQGLGRGTRPWYADGYDLDTEQGRLDAIAATGRIDCLVSDFARNLERLGPVNDPLIPGKRLGKGEMPIKRCLPEKMVLGIGCGEYNFTAARYCCKCKAEFIWDTSPKIEQKADAAKATRLTEVLAKWISVDDIQYSVYGRNRASAPSMMVTYRHATQFFTEMVSVQHVNETTRKYSQDWWRVRGVEPPQFTENGIDLVDLLAKPKWILVQLNTRHPKIVQVSFETEEPHIYAYDTLKEWTQPANSSTGLEQSNVRLVETNQSA